ncbi:MAG TPA: hypothetical protein VGI82_00715, partial [Chitinophagaceae bacterium]
AILHPQLAAKVLANHRLRSVDYEPWTIDTPGSRLMTARPPPHFPHTSSSLLFVRVFSSIFVVNQTPMNGAS